MEEEIKPPVDEVKQLPTIDELPTVGAKPPNDDFQLLEPEPEDVMDEIRQMGSFREYEREHRGDSLTYGDY
jgi:hypothetical protein